MAGSLRCDQIAGPCSVIVEGPEIYVEPTEMITGCIPTICPTDQRVMHTCVVPPLEAGEYTLLIGGLPPQFLRVDEEPTAPPALTCCCAEG